jgi:hypothetical protein
MIRTLITPQTDTLNISLAIPKSYIGKEMEVIAFRKDEGIEHNINTKKQVTFTVLHVENQKYKFNRDEANER